MSDETDKGIIKHYEARHVALIGALKVVRRRLTLGKDTNCWGDIDDAIHTLSTIFKTLGEE